MNLSEQVVLVTGAAGSLGRQLVSDLAGEAKRVIALDLDAERLASLAEEVPGCSTYACDLCDASRVEETIEKVYAEEPEVGVLINAAGTIHSEALVNLLGEGERRHDFERWRRIIDSNLHASFYVTACVAERMASLRTRGLVLGFSSIAAGGNAGQSAYAAAKAGVNAMTVAWSRELGPFGIRCAAIAPGFIDSPSTRAALSEAQIKRWTRATPVGRMGSVEELVGAVRFIIANDFFNGRVLELDGGLRI